MKRLPLYILLMGLMAWASSSSLHAQIAAGASAMQIPSKYINPSAEVSIAPAAKNAVMKGTVWYVYSDRDQNKTTRSPGKGGAVQTLSFLDDLVVYEEEGEFLHVVKDPGIDRRGKFSATAEDYGWISKNNLLLWGHCLVTPDAAKMNKKAMILNTLESLSGGSSDKFNKMASNEVKFAKDPGLKIASTRSSGLFSVFFIYKIDNTGKTPSVLLGRSERTRNGPRIKNVIEGWVPMSRIVLWDHRVALEPNWESQAATERKSGSKPVKFFKDRGSASTYRSGANPPNSSVLWNADPYNKRNLGEWRRFPVLDNTGSTVKVGLMGDINSKHGTMLPTVMAKIQDKHGTAKAGLRNIDIVFVVDGTSSMGPYFPPIAKAIQNSINSLSGKDISPNKLRFGAVVYRDYAENNRKVETIRLTKDGKSVADYLLKVDAKDYNDRDKPEAVFFGLREAVRNTGMDKSHTNIVVLVGDAGNHSRADMTQVSADDIINLFSVYNVNFLAFQAKNDGGDQTFTDFNEDNKQVIRTVARKKYMQIKESSVVKIRYPVWRDEGNLGRLEGGAMAGSLISSSEGNSQPLEKLQGEIEKIVEVSIEHADKFLQSVENIVVQGDDIEEVLEETPDSESQYVSSFAPSIMLYLKETLGLTEAEIKLIASKNYQLFMEAYAPLKVEGQKHPMFQYVLFLTRKELAELVTDLSKLVDASTNSEAREAMKNAWLSLLIAHIGDVPKSRMEEMSMEEVGEQVFGVPQTSGLLAKVKLKDLVDKAVVDDYTFQSYVTEIRNKLQKMEQIFNARNYQFSFESNDKSYYWIEQGLLP